jgi:hypothetical protein
MSSAYRKENPRSSENQSWIDKSQTLFGSYTTTMARTLYLCLTITATRLVITATHGASNIDIGLFGLAAVCDDERTLLSPCCLFKATISYVFTLVYFRFMGKSFPPSKKEILESGIKQGLTTQVLINIELTLMPVADVFLVTDFIPRL